MRRYASCVAIGLFAVVLSSHAAKAPSWTFNDAADIQGWAAINQTTLKVENGVLKVGPSTGPDPYFFPGGEWNKVSWEPFSGKEFNTLYVRLKASPAGTWQLYYVTVENGAWGEDQRQNYDVPDTGGQFLDAQVMIERGGWQERTVKGFRIDPGTAAGVSAEIDYLGFEPMLVATSVEPRGRLATSWARLKAGR
jgi:hypothetical protein